MSNGLVATTLTRNADTRVSIWREVAYTGRTIYRVDFVHQLDVAADRRSITWKVETTETAARQAANACYRRWNS